MGNLATGFPVVSWSLNERRGNVEVTRRIVFSLPPKCGAMRARLRAGIAIYNAGRYHAAHDAWEEHWLDLEAGTDDERLLHGLIQFTAVVHHATRANWAGVRGLAESASRYIDGLPPTYRGVDLDPVRAYLAQTATDPEYVERVPVPRLYYDGEPVTLDDLNPEETAIAAGVLIEADGFDETPIEAAARYALDDLARGDEGSTMLALLFDFVRESDHRGIIYQRLTEHVERRQAREKDVDGLFG